MNGICDTCKRNDDCRRPMDGMDSCRLYVSGKESNYEKLFGTPERAAGTIARWCAESDGSCAGCPMFEANLEHCKSDYTHLKSIVEWLEGDAE